MTSKGRCEDSHHRFARLEKRVGQGERDQDTGRLSHRDLTQRCLCEPPFQNPLRQQQALERGNDSADSCHSARWTPSRLSAFLPLKRCPDGS